MQVRPSKITPIPEGITAFTWADREQMLKKEVNIRRQKWVEESMAILNVSCPHWLMWLMVKVKRVGPRQLWFVRLVLWVYGLERLEAEKPGVGGICVISRRGKVVGRVSYEWPDNEDVFGKPQNPGDGGFDLQSSGGTGEVGP